MSRTDAPIFLFAPEAAGFEDEKTITKKAPPSAVKKLVCPPTPFRSFELQKTLSYAFPKQIPPVIHFGNVDHPVYVAANTLEVAFPDKESVRAALKALVNKVIYIPSSRLGADIHIQIAQFFPNKDFPTHASVYIWVNGKEFVLSKEFYVSFSEQPIESRMHLKLCRKMNIPNFDPANSQLMYSYEFEELVQLPEWVVQGKFSTVSEASTVLYKFHHAHRPLYPLGMMTTMKFWKLNFYNHTLAVPQGLSVQEYLHGEIFNQNVTSQNAASAAALVATAASKSQAVPPSDDKKIEAVTAPDQNSEEPNSKKHKPNSSTLWGTRTGARSCRLEVVIEEAARMPSLAFGGVRS